MDKGKTGTSDMNFVDQAKIFENFHGFALYAADNSALAADLLGLRFVDKNVEKDKGYQYYIKTAKVEEPLLWGSVLLVNKYEPLPSPVGLKAVSMDHGVNLIWDKTANKKFSAFQIEKSRDGVEYEILTKPSLVFVETEQGKIRFYNFIDTLAVNYEKCTYRVRGRSSFGEWTEPAEIVGMARDFRPPTTPAIDSSSFDKETNIIKLFWSMKDTLAADHAYNQVQLADSHDGEFSSVSEALDTSQTSYEFTFVLDTIERSHYFRIMSVDTAGNTSFSGPRFANVPDLVRPEPPSRLIGTVDDDGLVEVAWEPSVSKDAKGYFLYWSNDPTDEMSLVSESVIINNYYSWNIADVSLNDKIYFCVRAEDDVHNIGEPSEIIEVSRPDKIAPTSQILKSLEYANAGMHLTWVNSDEDDIVTQYLYRQTLGDANEDWILLDTLTPLVDSYVDTSQMEVDLEYAYSMMAHDEVLNFSDRSNILSRRVPVPDFFVEDLQAEVLSEGSCALSWVYNPKEGKLKEQAFDFEIFRSLGGETLSFYKTVQSDTQAYQDIEIEDSILYNYAVRVKYKNGWISDLSEIKSVILQ